MNYLYYNCLKSRSEDDISNKTKFKLFCETRWTEKHETLQVFDDMYEPLLLCLQAISDETEWDSKAKTESNGWSTETFE